MPRSGSTAYKSIVRLYRWQENPLTQTHKMDLEGNLFKAISNLLCFLFWIIDMFYENSLDNNEQYLIDLE